LGWFRSSNEKLAEFKDSYPGYIWLFKTPKGEKGRLQLLARVVWSDAPTTPVSASPGEHLIHYRVNHPGSLWYEDSDTEQAVEQVSAWVGAHFPAAVRANYQGANGQLALRGRVLQELNTIAMRLKAAPFGARIVPPSE
jgi:hypothetical protein